MGDCVFCDDFVGEVNGDGGVKGRTVGGKDICEQCLGELKFWLNGTLAKSPGMRNTPLKSDESEDSSEEDMVEVEEENKDEPQESEESNSEGADGDPFSSTPKI
ncbi:Uncharacterised protein [uncultured archaeon]|nr:Uncharacterised protein [uncultured archaeon]